MDDKKTLDYFYDQISSGINNIKIAPKSLRAKIKQGVRRNIQYWTDTLKPIYSQEALNFCNKICVDINTLPLYNARKKVGGNKNHPNLLPEHTTPISELIEMLVLSQESEYKTILEKHSTVCWVTKEENDRLNKNKFSKKRPNGWLHCYTVCGIHPIQ